MIRTVRRKFILVAMCSTFVVLFGIMAVILLSNYRNLVDRADTALTLLSQRELGKQTELKKPEPEMPPHEREALYEPRYFAVELSEGGEVLAFRKEKGVSVEEETAEKYGKEVLKTGKTSGFYKAYRYCTENEGEYTSVFFVDCARELDTMYRFFISSMLVSFLGLFLVFLLVLFFSRLVFRPVWESYEKQRRFITDASHELKTPLTIIDANTEVLEMLDGENEWTKSIKKQVKRLTSLTGQMVMLTRMEEGQEKISAERLDISGLVKEAADPFFVLAKNSGKELVLQVEKNLMGSGNKELLFRLVSILLDNSIKYSVPGSRIFLSLSQKGRRTVLKVSNETEMIQKGNLDILFERFYRTDASRNSETGGSGIGLSVAKAIVEAHKGKIHGESADGKVLVITAVW